MKKIYAFTFAELMISLTIIAVITALLYPTISELAPNNNKHLFRSAYKTIEMTVQDILSEEAIPGDITARPGSDPPMPRQPGEMPSNAKFTCLEFQKRLNCANITAAQVADDVHLNCGEANADGPQYLQTSNGMRWIFRSSGDTIIINVDVNASNNLIKDSTYTYGERQQVVEGVPQVDPDTGEPVMEGVPIEWEQGSFKSAGAALGTMQDTFTVQISKTGQVSLIDGREHIINTSQD